MLKIKKISFLITTLILIFNFVIAKTSFIVVHTNDTHGRILENPKSIGFAKISTYLTQLRQENEHVLFLDAGDTLHGGDVVNLSNGEAAIKIFNYLKLDAMAPGNHDFNYGYKALQKFIKQAKFNIISANVTTTKGKLITKPTLIKKLNNDVTVGIIGLSTPETTYKTHPANVKDLIFTDIVSATKIEVAKLKNEGVNFIIVLGHLGTDGSTKEYERSTALGSIEGIDLIVDGHSHTKLLNGQKAGNTLIVQTGEYDENLGYVEITIDDLGKKTIKAKLIEKSFFANIKEDKMMLDLINGYQKKQSKYLDKKVTTTTFKLYGDRELVRVQQTNLGSLISMALKANLATDVAFMNGGGIRASIEAGTITVRDILTTVPFGSIAVAVELSGTQIVSLLEQSVAFTPASSGGYLQVTGINFTINTSKKAGNRVSDVIINGKPIDLNKMYTAATLDFLTAGGDGYTIFKEAKVIASSDALDRVLTKYLIANPALTAKALETNIKVIK